MSDANNPSMRASIGFSEEQAQLLDIATSFCRDKSPIANVRNLIDDELGYNPAIWQEIAELGWLGIALPEEYGGIGLTLAEVVPISEQMGRTMLATPFASTTLAAQALLAGGSEEQKSTWLPKIIEGSIATFASCEDHADWNLENITATAEFSADAVKLSGTKYLVVDAASADIILATVCYEGRPAIAIIERGELPDGALCREKIIDETRRSYALSLDNIRISAEAMFPMDTISACLKHIELTGSLLLAAESCGGAQSVIEYTVDYLKTRKQFGKIIGSYQALKHPIVDAHVAYEKARSHLYSAAYSFSQQGEGEIATRMAKAEANQAFAYAADRAIQFHGGFGFTYDCDAQLYRRRAIWAEALFGSASYHRHKLADLMF